MISEMELKKLREKYPAGTVVVVDRMDDIQAVPAGTEGLVRIIDDVGTIHVKWRNGSGLGLIPGGFTLSANGAKRLPTWRSPSHSKARRVTS